MSINTEVGAIDLNRPHSEHDYEQGHGNKQKYTCSMHPEVITEHPGNCPKCGMKLVPKDEKKRLTPNAQHSTPNTTNASYSSHLSHSMH